MAKTQKPLFSLGARGTIADTLTFQKTNRVQIVRTKPVPTDPRSAAQLAQRQIFQDAIAAWHDLTAEEKETWRGVCRGLTAYQCFMKSELSAAPPPPPPEEFTEEQTEGLVSISGLSNGGYIRAGQRLTISNRQVTKLSFYIRRYNSPTGNVTFTIRKVSDDSLINSKVWGDAADLPTDLAWHEATFDTPLLINEEVYISAEFSGGGFNDQVKFAGATSDVKPGEWFEWYTSSWVKPAEWDLNYIYTYTLP